MSGTEDLLPSASDLDLNIDDDAQPKEEHKSDPVPAPVKEPEPIPELPKEEQKPEPLSETKLMHNRIDELTNALQEEQKKNQLLNQQMLLTKQQAMNQQMQERIKAKNHVCASTSWFLAFDSGVFLFHFSNFQNFTHIL